MLTESQGKLRWSKCKSKWDNDTVRPTSSLQPNSSVVTVLRYNLKGTDGTPKSEKADLVLTTWGRMKSQFRFFCFQASHFSFPFSSQTNKTYLEKKYESKFLVDGQASFFELWNLSILFQDFWNPVAYANDSGFE